MERFLTDPDLTELYHLSVKHMSAIKSGANGVPWLVVKAAQDTQDTLETSTIPTIPTIEPMQSEVIEKSEDTIIEAILEAATLMEDYTVTKSITEDQFHAYNSFFAQFPAELIAKARMDVAARRALPDSDYAYIDSKGGRHLPIQNANHVHAAFGRLGSQHFESPEDKTKAESKIRAKAKELGMTLADPTAKSAVMEFTPTSNGTISDGAESKLRGPVESGPKPHVNPEAYRGGENGYTVPTEKEIKHPSKNQIKRKIKKETTDEDWSIEVISKDSDGDSDGNSDSSGSNWASVTNPNISQTSDPGDGPWETYDADTLDSAARGLVAVLDATKKIKTREMIEGISGDPSDFLDAAQLEAAIDDLNSALSLIAALAYHEAAEEKEPEVQKNKIYDRLDGIKSHLLSKDKSNQLILEKGTNTSKEDDIMTTVTKEELAELVAKTSKDTMSEVLKARDAEDKAAKEVKKAKKAAKALKAANSANNDGEVTEEDLNSSVKATRNSLNGFGKKVDRKFIAKKEAKKEKALKSIQDNLDVLKSTIDTLASSARTNVGPILDGQIRGLMAENQSSGSVVKSTDDLARLRAEVEKIADPQEREQKSRELTLQGIMLGHTSGALGSPNLPF